MTVEEYAAMCELARHGKITPIVDIIETCLKEGKTVHPAVLDGLRSLDYWDWNFRISATPKSSRKKRPVGRPKNADKGFFYKHERQLLAIRIVEITYDSLKNSRKIPTKSELTKRILSDKELVLSDFAKLARTRRYELIDEIYIEYFKEKYPAGKTFN